MRASGLLLGWRSRRAFCGALCLSILGGLRYRSRTRRNFDSLRAFARRTVPVEAVGAALGVRTVTTSETARPGATSMDSGKRIPSPLPNGVNAVKQLPRQRPGLLQLREPAHPACLPPKKPTISCHEPMPL